MSPSKAEESSCDEKVRLLAEYDSATTEFSRTLSFLRERMGILSKTDYDLIRQASERARLRSERARLALEAHVAEHSC